MANGKQLWVEQTGLAEAATTLVFLNGLSQSTAAWGAIAPVFANTHRVVLLDLADQGQSGSCSSFNSYDAHAADVDAALAHLGCARVVLIGISYGSAVAQHLLVNHPERYCGAVLLSTFAHNTALFDAIGESWKAALLAGGYALLLDVMLPTVLGASYFEKPLLPIATLKASRVAAGLQPDRLLRLMQATETRGDYRPALRGVRVQVHVVQGAEDVLIPPAVAEQVAAHIAGASFVVLPGVGHTLNLEAIPQTIAQVRHLLNAIETRTVGAAGPD